jgi:hypothetical protein
VATSEFVAFLGGFDQAIFNLAALALMLVLAALAWRGRRPPRPPEPEADFPIVVLPWALGYGELVCTQVLLPNNLGSYWYGDWVNHYLTSIVFRGGLPGRSEHGPTPPEYHAWRDRVPGQDESSAAAVCRAAAGSASG